ncbi:MAG TPA: cyclase family protein [Bryobacteraceae bacterium]|nr:cyclase family protein [Bryobacteraceae bacterium]
MELAAALQQARVYDLAQPYFVGMPHFPTHPPFLFSLTKKHGDFVGPDGMSSAADAMTLGGHTGTHMDALNHFSCGGMLYGDIPVENVQTYARGVLQHSIHTVKPILRRGVLLDIATHQKLEALPEEFVITPEHLDEAVRIQKVEIHSGDVVLLRTGWARYFDDAKRFVSETHGPGPLIEGARWLSDRKVYAAGSDTIAFEKVPSAAMPVHVHLLVKSGIHIIEVLNLEELAQDGIYTFTFIAAPLKIRGGTGSPVRPLAIV